MLSLSHTRLLFAAAALLVCVAFAAPEARAQVVGPGHVLISEFRLEGPSNDFDEYIEFYCNRDTDCDISDYNIIAYDPSFGDFAVSFPAGVIIPARSYLLIGDDAGYSLSDYAVLDLVASFGGEADFFVDNEGIQLRNADQSVVIDSVGFIGGGAGDPASEINYVEGVGLQRATGARPDDQYAYVRKMTTASGGRPQDTNNNAADFWLVSVTGAAHPGITAPPVLGAPGPQNPGAALERNATIPISLIEPNAAPAAAPNRVRVGSGNSGTLSVRRSFTNNTGEDIVFLIFRVVDLTTLNSPGYSPTGGQADLRLISSADAEIFTNSQGREIVIRGTALEFDDGVSEPNQPNGGGINSSVAVELPEGFLAAGETIDVQFLLNVVKSGTFRFYIDVEAITGLGGGDELPGAGGRPTVRAGAVTTQPRRMINRNRGGGTYRPLVLPTAKPRVTRATTTRR